jgi:hypothetical protein
MAKEQRRSNREVKKPKQPKSNRTEAASLILPPTPKPRDGAAISDRSGGRSARR